MWLFKIFAGCGGFLCAVGIAMILFSINTDLIKTRIAGIIMASTSALMIGICCIIAACPYPVLEIYTAADLQKVEAYMEKSAMRFNDDKKQAKLMNDIDMSNFQFEGIDLGWNGTKTHFNGNGFALKNITLNTYGDTEKSDSGVGVFIGGGDYVRIDNLKLENLTINYYGQDQAVGALFGCVAGYHPQGVNIDNVYVSGQINASSTDNVGGLVGDVYYYGRMSITNCVSELEVNGRENVGGILGGYTQERNESFTEISNCENKGVVKGNDNVGGIVGYQKRCTVNDCENVGKVISAKIAGGITGLLTKEHTITDSKNSGSVEGNVQTGGIVGVMEESASVKDCSNEETGKVVTFGCDEESNTKAGGIAGVVAKKSSIIGCKNAGEVSSQYSKVGGIVGYCLGSVTGCHNLGKVKGANDVGGIIGHMKNNLAVSTCSAAGEISGALRVGGIMGRFGSDDLRTSLKSFFGKNDITIMNCNVTATITCNAVGGGLIGLIVNDTVDGDYLETNTFEGALTVGGVAKNDLWTVQVEK